MNQSGLIKEALKLPGGARFYKCALQVNPFNYLRRHNKPVKFTNEDDYNKAIVRDCQENGIEVIAITDHYRISTSQGLQSAAKQMGIYVFPGFEAVTKDGVHLLCLFDTNKDIDYIDRIIGDCGIHDNQRDSPQGKYDVVEFLEESKKWEAICIAAHATSDGGVLSELSGQSRISAWCSPHLLACSIPNSMGDVPENLHPILENKNLEYHRDHPIAIINAQDVCSPDGLAKGGSSSWIKMSEVTIEGLRQAFLDSGSRIRLSSDPMPKEHTEFMAMTWQGGFLDGVSIKFNENLNVFVGGRGAGKSTVVESLRYVLGLNPLGEDATNAHDGIVRDVLRSGTKISLFIRSYRPVKRDYLIERTIPNPPVVRGESGEILALTPSDIIPQVEVYGQHEISELTRSREKLTRLLERFVEHDPALLQRERDLKRELKRSRARILDIRKEKEQVAERLASLPMLEETLKRFQESGLEDRLKERSLLVREERILKTAFERLSPIRELLDQLLREIPIDRAFLSTKAIESLPGKNILSEADAVLKQLSLDLETVVANFKEVLDRTNRGLEDINSRWLERKAAVQAAYEKILRELQESKIDGEEFIRLRHQIEELRPLRERESVLQRDSKENENKRRNLLTEWEDVKAEEFRKLERAAKMVTRRLKERVRVRVTFAGNRESLFQLLRDQIGGRLSESIDILCRREDISLQELAAACRAGRDTLAEKFGIPSSQADRISRAPDDVIMQMEELNLPSTTEIELNVAPEGQPSIWRALNDLSTGQKATAVLLLLLLESDSPLVVDQPEDDLDNRFITEGIVPKMREEKRIRQFIFTTHNANIPVLGDAELILGLMATGEAEQGRATIPLEYMGSIDSKSVCELVEEVLEGGKDAFEMRRLKYGF